MMQKLTSVSTHTVILHSRHGKRVSPASTHSVILHSIANLSLIIRQQHLPDVKYASKLLFKSSNYVIFMKAIQKSW